MMTFNEIYKKHYRLVYNAIKKIVKNDMDAEELANEAMIRVHKHLRTYKEDVSKLTTWIFNIAKNVAIDFIRKKKLNTVALDDVHFDWRNSKETSQIDHLLALKSTEDNPEEKMISEELSRTMYAQFSTLSKADQLIASLHYFDGLSYEEVANEMSMPLGTVKAKIHKARVALMEVFPTEMRRLTTIER
jgi:RNA polymerase sigma-70 factor (ECF subfamily)